MKSVLSRALVATVLVLGCTPKGLDCGEPAALEPHPQNAAFKGAPLGPLLVRNFRDDATTAVITEYQQGYPLKVLVVVAKPFTKPLTMRGFRCSDGSVLGSRRRTPSLSTRPRRRLTSTPPLVKRLL